jgi:hypothetical protein
MVAPLKRDGVDSLDFFEEGVVEYAEEITKTEVDYFTAEELEGETLLDNTREAVLSIVRLSFREEHKWGFTDGTTKISAKIQDPRFWQDVQQGRAFAKGDNVLVSLRTRTFRRDNGELKSEYFIEQVIKMIHRPEQSPLDLPQ